MKYLVFYDTLLLQYCTYCLGIRTETWETLTRYLIRTLCPVRFTPYVFVLTLLHATSSQMRRLTQVICVLAGDLRFITRKLHVLDCFHDFVDSTVKGLGRSFSGCFILITPNSELWFKHTPDSNLTAVDAIEIITLRLTKSLN